MGATSETQICNIVLGRLGTQRILSLNDNLPNARLCKEQYSEIRDDLLRSHYWKFSVKRQNLNPDVTAPVNGFDYFYTLPADCLRIISPQLDQGYEWNRESNKLAANVETIELEYVSKVTDVTKFDDSFVECLILKLCAELAYAVTKNASLQANWESKFQQKIKEARSFSAQEASKDRVITDVWMRARY